MGDLAGALGRDLSCLVGVQGPVLEAIVGSRTVGKLAQVGAAVVFIDEPEGTSRGLPLLQPARSSHEVVEARESRGLECAVWRRACGKANVEMNSRLGDGGYKKRVLWEVSGVQIQAVP